jgi:hypothetical protein
MVEFDRALAEFSRTVSLLPRRSTGPGAGGTKILVPGEMGRAPAASPSAAPPFGTDPRVEPQVELRVADRDGDLARAARPTIVLTSVVLGAWLIGATITALAGLVRVLHDSEITVTEALLLGVGCLFAAATPVALYVAHLQRRVWPNSVRAVRLASDLTHTTVSVLVAYGCLSSVARLFHTVVWRTSPDLASGVWDIVLFVVSVITGLSMGGLAPLRRALRKSGSGSAPRDKDPRGS